MAHKKIAETIIIILKSLKILSNVTQKCVKFIYHSLYLNKKTTTSFLRSSSNNNLYSHTCEHSSHGE